MEKMADTAEEKSASYNRTIDKMDLKYIQPDKFHTDEK